MQDARFIWFFVTPSPRAKPASTRNALSTGDTPDSVTLQPLSCKHHAACVAYSVHRRRQPCAPQLNAERHTTMAPSRSLLGYRRKFCTLGPDRCTTQSSAGDEHAAPQRRRPLRPSLLPIGHRPPFPAGTPHDVLLEPPLTASSDYSWLGPVKHCQSPAKRVFSCICKSPESHKPAQTSPSPCEPS